MNIKAYYLFIFLLISCQDRNKYSDDNPHSFGSSLFQALKKNDTTFVIQVLVEPKDSLIAEGSNLRKNINRSFKEDTSYQKYVSEKIENFQTSRRRLDSLGVNWNNTIFQRFEFKVSSEDSTTFIEEAQLFFNSDGLSYSIDIDDIYEIGSRWKNFTLSNITNEVLKKAEREMLENEPYIPVLMDFTEATWNFNYSNPKEFENFKVRLKNYTSDEFDYIKYRVQIFDESTKEELFSKTYELNKKIYPEDLLEIDIPDLNGYFLGIDISNKGNFTWSGSLLDAKPHPQLKKMK